MNFAEIVKRQHSKGNEIEQIRSQAEVDLGRKLSKSEESLLLSRYSPSQLCQRIIKVCVKKTIFQI